MSCRGPAPAHAPAAPPGGVWKANCSPGKLATIVRGFPEPTITGWVPSGPCRSSTWTGASSPSKRIATRSVEASFRYRDAIWAPPSIHWGLQICPASDHSRLGWFFGSPSSALSHSHNEDRPLESVTTKARNRPSGDHAGSAIDPPTSDAPTTSLEFVPSAFTTSSSGRPSRGERTKAISLPSADHVGLESSNPELSPLVRSLTTPPSGARIIPIEPLSVSNAIRDPSGDQARSLACRPLLSSRAFEPSASTT